MNKSNQFTPDETINAQRTLWVAVVATIIAFASLLLSFFLVFRYSAWQVYSMAVIAGISLAGDVISVVLARRRQAKLAARILYWSALIVLPANVLLLSGSTLVLIGMVLVMGFAEVFLLFPPVQRRGFQ